MGKKAEQNKLTTGSHGVQLEHSTVYDDSLLPSADELGRLHAINPDMVAWLLKRTEVEQNARISFNAKRNKIALKELNYAGISTLLGLIFCFALIAGFFYLSYDLILKGYAVAGSIFGGIDLLAMFTILSKFQMRQPQK